MGPGGEGEGGDKVKAREEEGGAGVGVGVAFGVDFVTCSVFYPSNQLKSYKHPPVGKNVPPG